MLNRKTNFINSIHSIGFKQPYTLSSLFLICIAVALSSWKTLTEFVLSASNARMRLIRLSEAVEKLRRQAAVSVQTGKENEARELLFQKKKVMQAMEKLMTRIELFDQLYVKLNEV